MDWDTLFIYLSTCREVNDSEISIQAQVFSLYTLIILRVILKKIIRLLMKYSEIRTRHISSHVQIGHPCESCKSTTKVLGGEERWVTHPKHPMLHIVSGNVTSSVVIVTLMHKHQCERLSSSVTVGRRAVWYDNGNVCCSFAVFQITLYSNIFLSFGQCLAFFQMMLWATQTKHGGEWKWRRMQ